MADAAVLTRRESARGVHDTVLSDPALDARGVAEQYVGYEEWLTAPFTRGEVARCGVALILGFDDPVLEVSPGRAPRPLSAFVVGNQSGPSLTGISGHQVGVQIEFSPGGALALFGGDVAALNDLAVPIDEVLGQRGRRLVEQIGNAASWAERFDRLDAALGAVRSGSAISPVSPEVSWLRDQLVATSGRVRVEPLLDATGWSRRHMTALFRRQLGISPKAYGRIIRFEHVSAVLSEPGPNGTGRRALADVAVAAGYYDQSHLNRDFVALAGCTPGEFAAQANRAAEVRFVQDGERPDSLALGA
jgi:AraC-like DNA-binding protein